MKGTKIQLSERYFLLALGISALCFGVYTTEAYTVNDTSVYYGPEITVLPYGGNSGSAWTFHFPKTIVITYSTKCLESLTFVSENGEVRKLGGGYSLPVTQQTITLGPNEYITGFDGTIGTQDSYTVINGIRFFTSEQVLGPYGTWAGTKSFSFRTIGGIITGFHGIAGSRVVSIGAFLKQYCSSDYKLSMVESS